MDYQEQEEVGGSVPQLPSTIYEEEDKSDMHAQSLQNDFYLSLSESRVQK